MAARRAYSVALVLGLLVSMALRDKCGATDRIVGAEAPNGGAYLIKRFSVPKDAVITGVRFVNNDSRTTFPKVLLLQGPGKTVAEMRVLAEMLSVRPASAHRVNITVQPVVIGSSSEVYVAVAFPANAGVQSPGVGPGIGARGLEANESGNCYFAADAEGHFGAMDVDYEVELLFLAAGKMSAYGHGVDAPSATEVRVLPNPFNPAVTFEFDIPEVARVRIEIHDVAGRLVRILLAHLIHHRTRIKADAPAQDLVETMCSTHR